MWTLAFATTRTGHRQKWNAKSGVEIHFLSSGAQRLPASVNASAGLHAAQ
jgi:hypothetical protein